MDDNMCHVNDTQKVEGGLTRRLKNLYGHLWMICKFGLKRYWYYEKARRSGETIDYRKIFSPDELAKLGEHFSPVPWESS
jgi:hypothetical protein